MKDSKNKALHKMKLGSQHRTYGSTKKSDAKRLRDHMDVPK